MLPLLAKYNRSDFIGQHFNSLFFNIFTVPGTIFYQFVVQHYISSWFNVLSIDGWTLYAFMVQRFISSWLNILSVHGWTLYEFMVQQFMILHGFSVQHFINSWLNTMWVHGSTLYLFMVKHMNRWFNILSIYVWTYTGLWFFRFLHLMVRTTATPTHNHCLPGMWISNPWTFLLLIPAYNNQWAEWKSLFMQKNCAFKVLHTLYRITI